MDDSARPEVPAAATSNSGSPGGVGRVVLASANPKKAAELGAALRTVLGDGVEVEPRPSDLDDVDETEPTFVGNARLKAAAVSEFTGATVVADDSGLEVDALDGAPGVRSARFAGDHASDADNIALLLQRLGDLPADRRTARFRCVLVWRYPDGIEVVAEGSVEGTIADTPRGDEGFGYDPLFVPVASEGLAADGRTFAEMSVVEKASLSHRGRAVDALVAQLEIRGRAGRTSL